MKQLLFKLIFVPIVAFFPMMLTVAIMGSIIGITGIKEILPNGNAMPIWLVWCAVLVTATTIHHYFFKKDQD